MEKEFLDATEILDWLGISKPTLLAWLKKPENPLPGIKIGGRWKFRRQAILDWWERQEALAMLKNGNIKQAAKAKKTQIKAATSEDDHISSWLSAAAKILSEEPRKTA